MEDQELNEETPFWETAMKEASYSYLKKQRDRELENILMFCLQPRNFNSYGYFADIIVKIMAERNKKLMNYCEKRQQTISEYRKSIQCAKERAKTNPNSKNDCIV